MEVRPPNAPNAFDVDEGALSSAEGRQQGSPTARSPPDPRQSLLADPSLSGLARSVDVATSGGTVTLRGVVSTIAEKTTNRRQGARRRRTVESVQPARGKLALNPRKHLFV